VGSINCRLLSAGHEFDSCHCHQDKGPNATARAQWADSIITFRLAPLASTHPFPLRVVATPEYQYALEASADFQVWTPLTTNTAMPLLNYAPRWGVEFSDPGSMNAGYRFFRARQVYPAP
jgi:hypothetical protein